MRFCRVFSSRTVVFAKTRHGRTVARFAKRQSRKTNQAPVTRRRRLTRASLLRPSATTDFCSGSSPRTATRSWAAASPALSASSPTTTCPRARRVSASAARSEVRAAPRQTIRLPSPDASRARPEGIPGASRGRARASRLIPNDTARRPRPPPGAPGRPLTCPRYPRARDPDERRPSFFVGSLLTRKTLPLFPLRSSPRSCTSIRSRLEGLEVPRRARREPRTGPPPRARSTRPRACVARAPFLPHGEQARGSRRASRRARALSQARASGRVRRRRYASSGSQTRWFAAFGPVRRLRRRRARRSGGIRPRHGSKHGPIRVRRLPRVQGAHRRR